jgi:hypothetical protein
VAGRWLLVFPLLAAAALVKATALLLLPIILLVALRHLRANHGLIRPIAGGLALALLLTVSLYAVFWSGPETIWHVLRGVDQGGNYQSLPAAVAWIARRYDIALWAGRLPGEIGRVIFLVAYAALVARLWRGRAQPPDDWLRTGCDAFFCYLLIGAAWFWPWYISWLLALAALTRSTERQRAVIVFSALSLLYYFVADLRLPLIPYYSRVVVTLLVFGLPSFLFVRLLWRELRPHRPALRPDPSPGQPALIGPALLPPAPLNPLGRDGDVEAC